MLKQMCFVLLVTFLISISVYSLPQSPHPYPNDYDNIVKYQRAGAAALEVKFCHRTCVEEDQDFIVLLDGKDEEIAKYTGKELAGLTVKIPGDTVKIRLISNDAKNEYGYKVVSVKTLYSRYYQQTFKVDYQKAENLSGKDLKDQLYDLVKNHVSLGYSYARREMFGDIDNVNGYVRCVYTSRMVKTNSIPNSNNMNTEHSWPKSKGAKNEPAKSDLHHLFPTDSKANSRRSSYPFGIVVSVEWSQGESKLGKDSSHHTVFEPPFDHRGDVARCMFYFSIRYNKRISDYEEKVLRQWHQEDPVDSKEIERNESISSRQHNRNPFVDHPEYVNQISDF